MAKPDVRVRLTAEGVAEVVNSLKKIRDESSRTGKQSSKSFGLLNSSLSSLRNLAAGVATYLSVRTFTRWARGGLDAADQIGKLGDRIGTTTERASALAHVAEKSDGDLRALAGAAGILARRILELGEGDQTAIEMFERLGLAAADFRGKDTAEALGLVAERLATVESGFDKTGAVLDIFGRRGAELIPMLNEIGKNGLPNVVAQARELGVVLDDEAAAKAIQLNDDLATLRRQLEILAAQFTVGLVPAIRDGLALLTGDLADAGKRFNEFGEGAGSVLSSIIVALRILGAGGSIVIEKIVTGLGQIGIVAAGVVRGIRDLAKGDLAGAQHELDFAIKAADEAGKIQIERQRKRLQEIQDIWSNLGRPQEPEPDTGAGSDLPAPDTTTLETIARQRLAVQRAALENEVALFKAQAALRNAEDKAAFEAGLTHVRAYFAARRRTIEQQHDAEIAALEKEQALLAEEPDPLTRDREQQKIASDLQKLRLEREQKLLEITQEERKALDDLGTKRAAIEQTLLEAQGRRHEAELQNIELQIEEYDRLLRKQGVSDAARLAEIEEMRSTLTQGATFDELARQAQTALADLDVARQQLNAEVAAGLRTQINAEGALLRLEQDRLPALRLIADALLDAAKATGDPERVRQAKEFAAALTEMGSASTVAAKEMAQLADSAQQAIRNDLTNWLASGVDDAKNFGDAMRSLAIDVVESLRRISAQIIATAAIEKLSSLFSFSGGGEVQKKAKGGLIRGPGTGTSDSIPAWVSAGEYITRAAVVQQPGVLELLEALNRGISPRQIIEPQRLSFAKGGLATAAIASSVPASGPVEARLSVGLEDGLAGRVLDTPEGERFVVKIIAKNRRALSQLMR